MYQEAVENIKGTMICDMPSKGGVSHRFEMSVTEGMGGKDLHHETYWLSGNVFSLFSLV